MREAGRRLFTHHSSLVTFPPMPVLLALLTAERVEAWVTWGGSLVIFALLFACGLGLPLPEDIPLLVGGYFVGQGKMHLVVLSVLAWCGIIGGDCCLYFLSRRYGLNVTRLPLVGRHVTEKRILWAEQKFERYGIADVRVRIKHYEHYVVIGAVVLGLAFAAYFFWRHRRLKAELLEEDARRRGESPATPGPAEGVGAS
jgi:membrane protein DedA with SNARE-associated domain